MSQKNISELIVVSPVLLFVRRHINIFCLLLFLFYTKGSAFYALRISISMLMFRHWGKDERGRTYGPESAQYQELYSIYHMDILAGTLTAGVTVILIGAVLVWIADIMGSYKSSMTREARHMRYWTRQEIKTLENQGRLLASLKNAEALNETSLKVIEKMEVILLRYEQRACALHPDKTIRPKLSEKEETIGDLIEWSDLKTLKEKPSPEPKKGLKFRVRKK